MPDTRTKLTPPMIAARYGCSPEKVVNWIRAGELRAFNSASSRRKRPRFLVDEADLKDFEASRSPQPSPPAAQHNRRRKLRGIKEFY